MRGRRWLAMMGTEVLMSNAKTLCIIHCVALLFVMSVVPAGAELALATTYVNDAAFSAATGALSLTGPLPDLGSSGPSVTVGDATLTSPVNIFVEDTRSTLILGNEIVIQGPKENLTVLLNSGPAKAFGFYFHEPTAHTFQLDGCGPLRSPCVDSTFDIAFYLGGVLVDSVIFSPADDQLIFFGITLDVPFDEVRFMETGTNDNEFYGEMYVAPSIPERLTNLVAVVIGMNLQAGIENSFDAKLDTVMDALDGMNSNNDIAARNAMYAFISAAEAQRGKELADAQADELVALAQQIIAVIEAGL